METGWNGLAAAKEAGRVKQWIPSPWGLRREPAIWTSHLQNQRANMCCFKPRTFVRICSRSRRKPIQPTSVNTLSIKLSSVKPLRVPCVSCGILTDTARMCEKR